jgi:hypothetical protein
MRTAKLEISDVIDIRRMSAQGATSAEIAESFGIVRRHVNNIITGGKWGSVPQDRVIKNFPNYAVTVDGRVFSFSKNDYLSTKMVDRKAHVKLSKTMKNGTRTYKTVSVDSLVKSHFA